MLPSIIGLGFRTTNIKPINKCTLYQIEHTGLDTCYFNSFKYYISVSNIFSSYILIMPFLSIIYVCVTACGATAKLVQFMFQQFRTFEIPQIEGLDDFFR